MYRHVTRYFDVTFVQSLASSLPSLSVRFQGAILQFLCRGCGNLFGVEHNLSKSAGTRLRHCYVAGMLKCVDIRRQGRCYCSSTLCSLLSTATWSRKGKFQGCHLWADSGRNGRLLRSTGSNSILNTAHHRPRRISPNGSPANSKNHPRSFRRRPSWRK